MRTRALIGVLLAALLLGAGFGLLLARMTTWNPFALTAHELDVIRTMAGVVGALGGTLTIVNMVFSILSRKWAKRAADQTATTHWVDGKQRVVPVTEYARHASFAGEAARQETADLSEWVRGTGRRRLTTADVPTISLYETGLADE